MESIEKLLDKWDPMISHIKSERKQNLTAKLLENEEKWFNKQMLTESGVASEAGAGCLDGTVNQAVDGTQGIAKYMGIAMPLVARVFPELITNDLVGVQPMFTPVGLAYALRYRYTSGDAAGVEAGYNTVYTQYSGSEDITGATDNAAVARYGNHSTIGNTLIQDITGNLTQGANSYLTQDGERLDTNGKVCGGETGNIREMGLTIEKKEITAHTRKLKARWTLEAQQDLANMHNVDVEEELTDLLAYEIAAEIDLEIKNRIIVRAVQGGILTWNYGTVGEADGNADGRWEQEKFRTLYTLLLKASNEIAVATRRGAGNFVIASPGVVAAIESLDNFLISPVAASLNTEVSGVAKVGTLGRFTVYRDSFAAEDYAVVGYKGPKDNDAGIIYAPYVPVMFSRTTQVESFQPVIGVMTRYGICDNLFGAENYYRFIQILGLQNSTLAGSRS
ncbi:MAG: hypothetical protein ACOC80_15300 [Petrotogales bacterium]